MQFERGREWNGLLVITHFTTQDLAFAAFNFLSTTDDGNRHLIVQNWKLLLSSIFMLHLIQMHNHKNCSDSRKSILIIIMKSIECNYVENETRKSVLIAVADDVLKVRTTSSVFYWSSWWKKKNWENKLKKYLDTPRASAGAFTRNMRKRIEELFSKLKKTVNR